MRKLSTNIPDQTPTKGGVFYIRETLQQPDMRFVAVKSEE